MSQPPDPPQPIVKRRSLSQWMILFSVWGVGLVVWGVYVIALVYLFFKFLI